MTNRENFRQANAFAMVDGLKFSIYWVFGFICVIKGISGNSLSTLGFLVTISAPFLGAFLARRFEKQVRTNGAVGFGKAYAYSICLYLYAAAILAIFGYIYFNWIDQGSFVNSYIAAINSPEIQEAMSETNMKETLNTIATNSGFNTFEQLLRSITPVDIAAALFNTNILLGIFLSLPTALFAKTRPNDMEQSQE